MDEGEVLGVSYVPLTGYEPLQPVTEVGPERRRRRREVERQVVHPRSPVLCSARALGSSLRGPRRSARLRMPVSG